MKVSNIFIVAVVVVLAMICSCKKGTVVEPAPPPTALEIAYDKAKQRWTFNLFVHNETKGTVSTSDSIKGMVGDYFEFKGNNSVYGFWGNLHDTTYYELLSPTQMIYSGDTFTIEVLNAESFNFFKKQITDTVVYEDKIWLSR